MQRSGLRSALRYWPSARTKAKTMDKVLAMVDRYVDVKLASSRIDVADLRGGQLGAALAAPLE